MFISLKTKIWLTVVTIVLLFTFFTFFYFPAQQRKALLKNYNNEVQNLANTVALGVRIALNEQNYDGVKTAMEFVKGNPGLKFVALLQSDTTWNAAHNQFQVHETVFKTVPDSLKLTAADTATSIVKRAAFSSTSSNMSGVVLLGFSTDEITLSRNAIRRTSLQVSALIFIIGLLLGLWLSRRISGPVQALRDAAKRVSKGDLTASVKRFSHDEIGDLAKAFNKMVRDLAAVHQRLNQSNQTLSDTNAALNHTLEDLKATQAQLVQSEKMASLGELTAGIAHEIQNPLNFVNNFSEINAELIDEMNQELHAGNTAEAVAISNDLKENNLKIAYHGKRADAIVKGMLQHSRKNTGQKELTDINALADEFLRLSYHGLRAKDKSFNADFKTDFDESIGKVNVIPQDIGRVLLNLYNNAFYAVQEKKKKGIEGYEPIVLVSTKRADRKIQILVKDNGIGIPQNIIDKLFQPFFTTKPTGEGTGLGLSLAYDIITKEHNGAIKVESKEGEGSIFIIQIS